MRSAQGNKYFSQGKDKAEESLLAINDKNISDFNRYRVAELQVTDAVLKKKV